MNTLRTFSQNLSTNGAKGFTFSNNKVFKAKITDLNNPYEAPNNLKDKENDFKNEIDLNIGDEIKAKTIDTDKEIIGKIVSIEDKEIKVKSNKTNKVYTVDYSSIDTKYSKNKKIQDISSLVGNS